MRTLSLIFLIVLISVRLSAQKRIDSSFSFQTNSAKKYSIYVPSNYVDSVPNKFMLGLHPFNTNRWNAESWCDTLINFAEENNLLLICPDGGADGRVDDAIDTAFTTTLLDSMRFWYNVDTTNTYAMGFSWGARTTYTYGLSNSKVFGGFMPIGAAVNRTTEVTVSLQNKSKDKPFYIIHGSADIPAIRFFPVRDSLIAKGAIVKTNYLSGVGHTIDFANRDSLLTVGFKWIDSVNNSQLVSIKESKITSNEIIFFPNPIKQGSSIQLKLSEELENQASTIIIYTLDGREVLSFNKQLFKGINTIESHISTLSKGAYLLSINLKSGEPVNGKLIIE